jgi:hypothetical protein
METERRRVTAMVRVAFLPLDTAMRDQNKDTNIRTDMTLSISPPPHFVDSLYILLATSPSKKIIFRAIFEQAVNTSADGVGGVRSLMHRLDEVGLAKDKHLKPKQWALYRDLFLHPTRIHN